MMNWNDPRTRFALEAVQKAARLAAEIQAEMVTQAITKQDRSPVTVADFAAQAVVGYLLEMSFPGELLVGEEQAEVLRSPEGRETLERTTAYVNRVIPGLSAEEVLEAIDRGVDAPGQRYWTLDPIDGTKGFLRRAQYAGALAYVEDGKVQLGVLGCPNISPALEEAYGGPGSLLVACRGEGSWAAPLADDLSGRGFRRIRVSSQSDPRQARLLRSYESSHTNTELIDRFQAAFGAESEPVRMDSQVKYALLASGKGEIVLRLLSPDRPDYREKIWDQAAGSVIVEEAGGMITDLDGKPLDFSQGRTLRNNRGICASSGHFHALALQALRTVNA